MSKKTIDKIVNAIGFTFVSVIIAMHLYGMIRHI